MSSIYKHLINTSIINLKHLYIHMLYFKNCIYYNPVYWNRQRNLGNRGWILSLMTWNTSSLQFDIHALAKILVSYHCHNVWDISCFNGFLYRLHVEHFIVWKNKYFSALHTSVLKSINNLFATEILILWFLMTPLYREFSCICVLWCLVTSVSCENSCDTSATIVRIGITIERLMTTVVTLVQQLWG